MEAVAFRASVFGGFRRKDVIDYIEKSALEANRRIDFLKNDTDGLVKENRSLRDEVTALGNERDRLDALLRESLGSQERLRAELDAIMQEVSSLRTERDALKNKVEALRPQVEQFTAIKSSLAEMELSARCRADSYDAEVRGKADAYERETRRTVNAMLNDVRARCNEALTTLIVTCEDVAQRLNESRTSLVSLPEALSTLQRELDALGESEN